MKRLAWVVLDSFAFLLLLALVGSGVVWLLLWAVR